MLEYNEVQSIQGEVDNFKGPYIMGFYKHSRLLEIHLPILEFQGMPFLPRELVEVFFC